MAISADRRICYPVRGTSGDVVLSTGIVGAALRRTVVAMGFLVASAAAAQSPGVHVVRTQSPAQVSLDGNGRWQPLAQADRVADGSEVRSSAGGRIALQLTQTGHLILGGDAWLRLHSSEIPDPPARMGLARLLLKQGALRVDARRRESFPPADVRINVGPLQMRIFGAEAWVESTAAGQEVCLLSGAVEIMTPASNQRLDEPGECLRYGSHGARRLSPGEAGPLPTRLLRTAFADDVAARLAASQAGPPAPPVPGMSRGDAPPATAPPPPPSPPEQAPAPSPLGLWTLVLASMPNEVAAERAAERLARRGLQVQIEPTQQGARTLYRLTYGAYPNRDATRQDLEQLRRLPGLEQAWALRRK